MPRDHPPGSPASEAGRATHRDSQIAKAGRGLAAPPAGEVQKVTHARFENPNGIPSKGKQQALEQQARGRECKDPRDDVFHRLPVNYSDGCRSDRVDELEQERIEGQSKLQEDEPPRSEERRVGKECRL